MKSIYFGIIIIFSSMSIKIDNDSSYFILNYSIRKFETANYFMVSKVLSYNNVGFFPKDAITTINNTFLDSLHKLIPNKFGYQIWTSNVPEYALGYLCYRKGKYFYNFYNLKSFYGDTFKINMLNEAINDYKKYEFKIIPNAGADVSEAHTRAF